MLGPFERFSCPRYAVATIAGFCLFALCYLLILFGVTPSLLYLAWFAGGTLAIVGSAWYLFHWLIDHGTKYIARR